MSESGAEFWSYAEGNGWILGTLGVLYLSAAAYYLGERWWRRQRRDGGPL